MNSVILVRLTCADAILANTAVATAENPAQLARAFALAVEAGRIAYLSGLPIQRNLANPSSPLTGFLYEKNDLINSNP